MALRDGITDYNKSYSTYGPKLPGTWWVSMHLTDDEYKEFREWVNAREAAKTNGGWVAPTGMTSGPAPGSLKDLELRRDGLRAQVEALNIVNNLQAEIKTYESILASTQEAEERKKYPHVFHHGGYCTYCEADPGFFGRNEGKPCAARYEESKKQPPVVDIKLVLRKRGPSYKMIFRKLDGGLLPPGKYTARIAETVEVDCERFNFNNVVPK